MRYTPALLACALLLSGPVRAQEEEEGGEQAEEPSGEISAPEAPPAAPIRRAGPAFRPGQSRAPSPAVGSGGGGGGSAPARLSSDNEEGHSLGGAGIGRAEPDASQGVPVRQGGVPPMRELGGGGAGGAGFQEIDIGLLPIIGQVLNTNSGPDRPVVYIAGGKKWAIKIQYKRPGRAAFPLLLGGTNGAFTGGGKYRYKAAISKTKGVVSGPGALCEGQMHNAAYVTCQQPCSMQWDIRFGTPQKDRHWKTMCELDQNQVYYLNVAPEGDGCSGGAAEGNGCPLVMEIANSGTLLLNPSGVAAACAHRGFGSDGISCQ